MKVTKTGRSSKGVFVQRDVSSGKFTTIKMPGKGPVTVVKGDTLISAKKAAGSRLKLAIENTGGWKTAK